MNFARLASSPWTIRLSALAVAAVLAGCGGGGGGDDDTSAGTPGTTTPGTGTGTENGGNTGGNTGSISARFVPAATSLSFAQGISIQSFSTVTSDNIAQAADGSFTRIGALQFDSNGLVTKDIAGDSDFAIGRIDAGSYTSTTGGSSTSHTISASTNDALHYLLFNVPASAPASGVTDCTSGAFTAPTFTNLPASVSNPVNPGTATAQATVTFDGTTKPRIEGIIELSTSQSSGSLTFDTSTSSTLLNNTVRVTGGFMSGQPGAAVSLAANGSAYRVALAYSATLTNGVTYNGTAVLNCK